MTAGATATRPTFRIGNSKSTLTGSSIGKINAIVTDPATGIRTNQQAILDRKG